MLMTSCLSGVSYSVWLTVCRRSVKRWATKVECEIMSDVCNERCVLGMLIQSGSETWPRDENGAVIFDEHTSVSETWEV